MLHHNLETMPLSNILIRTDIVSMISLIAFTRAMLLLRTYC